MNEEGGQLQPQCSTSSFSGGVIVGGGADLLVLRTSGLEALRPPHLDISEKKT